MVKTIIQTYANEFVPGKVDIGRLHNLLKIVICKDIGLEV